MEGAEGWGSGGEQRKGRERERERERWVAYNAVQKSASPSAVQSVPRAGARRPYIIPFRSRPRTMHRGGGERERERERERRGAGYT